MTIGGLEEADREPWERLARGYKDFYETILPDREYAAAWQRLRRGQVQALVARVDGELVGLVHFLYHAGTWADEVCYLQDLYVAAHARRRGVARALIERVAQVAGQHGASLLYWHTRDDNATARALYERVARHDGFIRYDRRLD